VRTGTVQQRLYLEFGLLFGVARLLPYIVSMRSTSISLALSSFAVALVVACATKPVDDGPPDYQNATGTDPRSATSKNDAGKDAGPSTPPSGGEVDSGASEDADIPTTDAGNDAGSCQDLPSATECNVCCYKTHRAGTHTYDDAVRSCACAADGDCKEACAESFCKSQPYEKGDACHQCLMDSVSCGAKGVEACKGDPDCVALKDCNDACASKP
jgi:hypothetical protein